VLDGTAGYWAEQIVRFYQEYRQDTFIFWGAGEAAGQIEAFAREVVPAVKGRLAAAQAPDGSLSAARPPDGP
jgi:hypothetical protein